MGSIRKAQAVTRLTAAVVLVIAMAVAAAACSGNGPGAISYETNVVAEGLSNPVGLAVLPTGGLLVAEEGTGQDDESAGISLVNDGRVDRIVSGLPSGRDSGDLSGVPMIGISPDGSTVYTSHFGAEALLTFPTPSQKAVDAGAILGPQDLRKTMTPLNAVRLTNAFDITFSEDGSPVVSDASENGVAVLSEGGQTQFVHRFGTLQDPEQASQSIDPVPTGIVRLGQEFLVTLTGGCPYPAGSGRLVAVDGQGGERAMVTGLNMPIDVAVDDAGTIWVLEFAQFDREASCFSGEGYLPATGRLSRVEDDVVVPVIEGLDFPGAIAIGPDGSMYVTEIFAGRILEISPTDGDQENDAALAVDPARRWAFSDVADSVGVDFHHAAFAEAISADPVAMMGGGVCWLDADGDDDLDLYFVNSFAEAESDYWNSAGGHPASRLFRNNGAEFEPWPTASDVDLAIRGNGCTAADVNGDGAVDLYVTADGPNALLINDGQGQFVDQAAEAGVAVDGWSSASAIADVDGDGHLDLLVGTYIDFERTVPRPIGAFPQDYLGEPNLLFLGQGDGTFVDASEAAGLEGDLRTLGALFSDLDQDGDLDLYLTNDGQANTLYENRSRPGSPRLVDVTSEAEVGDTGSGMGVAGGDYDSDGAIDLMVTNWEAELHALYRGESGSVELADDLDELAFEYSTHRIGFAGLGNGLTGWGTAWADLDNDRDLDLLITNGRVPVSNLATDPEPIQILGNLTAEGQPGQLRDWDQRTGLNLVGPRLGRGMAVADYDNDGDLDVAINQIAGPATLLRNDDPPGQSLQVDVDPPTPGTMVEVRLSDGSTLRRQIYAGSSYLSSNDPRPHIGLGDTSVESVVVTWPDGHSETLESPASTMVRVARSG